MVIDFVSKLVKTITLSRVIIWSLAGLVGVLGYTAFENRKDLFDFNVDDDTHTTSNALSQTFTLSATSKEELKEFTDSDKSVVGVAVLTADIRLNVRKALYSYAIPSAKDNPDQQFKNISVQRLPLFTNDPENNRQMVKLINGEFHCAPYATSALAKATPGLNKNVVSICRVSLPPYYGYFSGFITAFLSVDPDIDKQFRLRSAMESIATRIYLRDVISTSKTSPF